MTALNLNLINLINAVNLINTVKERIAGLVDDRELRGILETLSEPARAFTAMIEPLSDACNEERYFKVLAVEILGKLPRLEINKREYLCYCINAYNFDERAKVEIKCHEDNLLIVLRYYYNFRIDRVFCSNLEICHYAKQNLEFILTLFNSITFNSLMDFVEKSIESAIQAKKMIVEILVKSMESIKQSTSRIAALQNF